MRLTLGASAAALATVLALAACGTQTTSNTGTPAADTTSSTTTTTASASVVTKTVTASASSGGGCLASGLKLTFLGQQGATGHGELGFALQNTGSAACGTFGYPGVQFTSRSGALLPTRSTRTTSDFFGHSPLGVVQLAPGQSASFRLGVTHGISSPKGCTTAYGLRVFPPNDTVALTASIPHGAYECGTATVSPMRTGTTAYP